VASAAKKLLEGCTSANDFRPNDVAFDPKEATSTNVGDGFIHGDGIQLGCRCVCQA